MLCACSMTRRRSCWACLPTTWPPSRTPSHRVPGHAQGRQLEGLGPAGQGQCTVSGKGGGKVYVHARSQSDGGSLIQCRKYSVDLSLQVQTLKSIPSSSCLVAGSTTVSSGSGLRWRRSSPWTSRRRAGGCSESQAKPRRRKLHPFLTCFWSDLIDSGTTPSPRCPVWKPRRHDSLCLVSKP